MSDQNCSKIKEIINKFATILILNFMRPVLHYTVKLHTFSNGICQLMVCWTYRQVLLHIPSVNMSHILLYKFTDDSPNVHTVNPVIFVMF